MRRPRGDGRHDVALLAAQKTSAPSPYPAAMDTPVTSPCSSGLRGSREGVSEKPKKTRAPRMPP